MGTFELELDEKYLCSLGKITANFATLEQIISFFIWNLVKKDESFGEFVKLESPLLYRQFTEFLTSSPDGLKIAPGKRQGQIITSELSFRQKIDLLSALYQDIVDKPSAVTALQKLLDRARQAEDKRNIVTHSLWTMSDKKGKVNRIKATARNKKQLNLQIQRMSVEDLESIATEISEVAYEIQTSVIRFYNPSFDAGSLEISI
jgi:hypothetical protein